MGGFMSAPNASGTKIESNSGTIDIKGGRLNIGKPCPSRMLFGVAYSVAETESFATIITFDRQF